MVLDSTEIQRRIIYGKRVVAEALKAREQIEEVCLNKSFSGELITEIKTRGIPLKRVSDDTLTYLCGSTHHQGIVAITTNYTFASMETLLAESQKTAYPIILALDEIMDPHNIGAILRSAEGAGVTGILMSERRTSPITTTVVKTSAGAVFHHKIVRVKNLLASLKLLKEKGFWIAGTHQEGNLIYHQFDFCLPLVLILGGEGKGLRENILRECDYLINIPMEGKIESLNVSVAAGIILFEALKQRTNNQ